METVTFRFNKQTGQVEEFRVDFDSVLARPEHNDAHERSAAEWGRLLDPEAGVAELLGQPSADEPERAPEDEAGQNQRERQARR